MAIKFELPRRWDLRTSDPKFEVFWTMLWWSVVDDAGVWWVCESSREEGDEAGTTSASAEVMWCRALNAFGSHYV